MTKAIQPSTHGVHAIAVGATAADGHEWGVIDSTRLLEPGAPLSQAARVMNERKVTHLVVDGGHPAGIISALDVAGAVAWGRT
jgi:CBS domain-containing protein